MNGHEWSVRPGTRAGVSGISGQGASDFQTDGSGRAHGVAKTGGRVQGSLDHAQIRRPVLWGCREQHLGPPSE
jgi:hypothetical protein